MDAVKYFEIRNRMTKSCSIGCDECDFVWYKNGSNLNCNDFQNQYPEEAVAIVEKWAEEHKAKTRSEVFFERFPDAPRAEIGVPRACAKTIGLTDRCPEHYCYSCWQQPAPDKYQD